MGSSGCSEIVESGLEQNVDVARFRGGFGQLRVRVRAAGEDLDRLIQSNNPRPTNLKSGKAPLVASSSSEIIESVSLKQALRRLCLSQASEMAAAKRLTRPSAAGVGMSGASEAGALARLYASVLVDADGKSSAAKASDLTKTVAGASKVSGSVLAKKNASDTSSRSASPSKAKAAQHKTRIQDVIGQKPMTVGKKATSAIAEEKPGKAVAGSASSGSSFRLIQSVTRNKTGTKKKVKPEPAAVSSNGKSSEAKAPASVPKILRTILVEEPITPSTNCMKPAAQTGVEKHVSTPTSISNSARIMGTTKSGEFLRSKEKGECSQSSKSSIGDYSSSTSISEDSYGGFGGTGGRSRPHMSKDVRWVAVRRTMVQHGSLGLKNFRLVKKLGCGDIGTVYLAELVGSDCLFALKVMDVEFLISRKKMLRAQTEKDILQVLDHPFLPTLYAHFTTDNLSCLVMEFCPGGDLHVLRQKQPSRCFSEPAARFYVAEVLLALEYLHMLGIIYRDLKPENILVREDGHIMLSDFDLSLRCSVSPMLVRCSSVGREEPGRPSVLCSDRSCIDPLCMQPSWGTSCFTPRLVPAASSTPRKPKAEVNRPQGKSLPQLVVEPTEARSNSFVGTHEYLAPEIIRGDGHGSSVDWWTLGIFLYELLYGRTPFKGPGNEETLANVISQSLKFPDNPSVSAHAEDLIRGLLVKDPESRLGSIRGAAEIKRHPFFNGLNWALIRCAAPPETLRMVNPIVTAGQLPVSSVPKKKEGKCLDFRSIGGADIEFELF